MLMEELPISEASAITMYKGDAGCKMLWMYIFKKEDACEICSVGSFSLFSYETWYRFHIHMNSVPRTQTKLFNQFAPNASSLISVEHGVCFVRLQADSSEK